MLQRCILFLLHCPLLNQLNSRVFIVRTRFGGSFTRPSRGWSLLTTLRKVVLGTSNVQSSDEFHVVTLDSFLTSLSLAKSTRPLSTQRQEKVWR
jgi:hypothetical protein